MVFRVAAEPTSEGEVPVAAPLARVDASGQPGRDALAGHDGSDGSYGGGRGGDGGRAGGASRGQHAGDIRVSLASAGPSQARIEGVYRDGEGPERPVNSTFDFSRAGEVELCANGGDGGDGGRGGAGGRGGKGHGGSSATRYSSGGDGGPGGRGGDGGHGSNGAQGGNGANIRVRMSEQDTHLAMLVSKQYVGGQGGRAGRHGSGGSGGAGGDGGSSYSWSETESYTDSQGQSQTRTTYHSNPGGSDGPRGPDGHTPSAALYAGAQGNQGSFAFEVIDARGQTRSYPDRYELTVVGFTHDNDNRDGVYEPDEKVVVSQLAVKNTGAMPTPSHHDVVVGVLEQGWVSADPEQLLRVPRGLAPGATHVFKNETLTFALQGHAPQGPGEPLRAVETIHLQCALPAARRRFGAFESTLDPSTGQIVVRFPVELTPVESLFSLAQGQATRVRFALRNVASAPIGRQTEGARELAVRLRLAGGELTDGEVIVLDASGARARLDEGFHKVIEHVGPGCERRFELVIAVSPDARPYTSARFLVAAELAYIDDPRNARPVHLREVVLRVGVPFAREGADVLLVVNNRTDREELASWQRLCKELGLSAALWDASLEGGLAVLDAQNARFSLAIVLDYAMDGASGESRPSELLTNEQLFALRGSCSTLFVGDARAPERFAIRAQSEHPVETIERWYLWPWSEPAPAELTREAARTSEARAAIEPNERAVYVQRFEPKVTKKTLFARKISLGTLQRVDALPPSIPGASELSIDALSAHSPLTIGEEPTVAAVLDALPFEKKLSILNSCALPYGDRTLKVEGGVEDALVAAVVSDLLFELASVCESGWKSGLDSRALVGQLRNLRALRDNPGAAGAAIDSDAGKRAIELCAWLELLASECSRWWEWLPFAWGFRRGPVLRGALREARFAIGRARIDGERAQKDFDQRVTARRRAIEAAWKTQARRTEGAHSPLDALRARLQPRFGGRTHSDARALLPPSMRVIDGAAHDARASREGAITKDAAAFVELAHEARAELLCDRSFAEYQGRAERKREEDLRAFAEGADDAVARETSVTAVGEEDGR